MNNKIIKTIVFVLIIIFYGSFLVHKIDLPQADDLARHIKNGELLLQGNLKVTNTNIFSYTEPDHTFINHHWIFGIIVYVLHQLIGWEGLVLCKVFIILTTFTILFLTALKKANFWLISVLSVPTILVLYERTSLRPEIFSYLFIALFLYFLTDLDLHPERKRIFFLIPLQMLWVNTHIFFIIGPALTAGFLFEKILINYKNFRTNQLVKKLIVVFLLLILACLVNPNGPMGATYPLHIFENYGIRVSENQPLLFLLQNYPPSDNISIFVFFSIAFVLAISFIFALRKKSIFYGITTAATIIAAIRINRLLPLFCYIFLPIASANLVQGIPLLPQKWKKWLGSNKILKNLFVLFFVILLGYLIYLKHTGVFYNYKKSGIGLTRQSLSSANFFKEHDLKGPIFNDYDIGSYLIYSLYPKERVFVDNRPEAYSTSFFKDTYLPIFLDENTWQKALNTYKFNVIFFYQYDQIDGMRPFIYKRLHDPSWSLIYIDSYAIILLKNTPENERIINPYHINSENVEQKLKYLTQSPYFDEQVAAGDMFFMLDRMDLAFSSFLHIVKQWPKKGKIWMVLGTWEIYRNNPNAAVQYLNKAITVGYSTVETYYYLGAAYTKLGKYNKAKELLQKAVWINPDYKNAKILLGDIESHSGQ